MIELGLGRISRLLQDKPIPWRAIHVAGTNGKGSVCSYASAMLTANNVHCGRFNSPHLIDRWDCISIDDKVVDHSLFRHAERAILSRNEREGIKASEFELLTATAFEVFSLTKVEVGIVEVGVGGRHDATNILQDPLVTVITKISRDHQALLGDSLEQIAYHKAGIMKQGTPCVVDGSNSTGVIEVLKKEASVSQAAYMLLVPQEECSDLIELQHFLSERKYLDHQEMNMSLAYKAVNIATARLDVSLDSQKLFSAIEGASWPARLQILDISSVVGHSKSVLLDGAHNAQSAQILGLYVDRNLRHTSNPVTWIIGVSQGKDVRTILSKFLKPGDNFIAETFGPVEGMPWVHPTHEDEVIDAAVDISREINILKASGNLEDTIRHAAAVAAKGPVVIAGSLYLASDVLRSIRNAQQPYTR